MIAVGLPLPITTDLPVGGCIKGGFMKITKKYLQLFLFLIFTMSIFPALKTLADTKAVTTYDLNLRAEAAWDGEQIGVIPNGELVSLLDKGEVWSEIDYDGTIGYVPSQYISKWGVVKSERYATSTDEVSLRKAADSDSAVLAVIDEGTTLKVKAVNGDYLKLEADGIVGYSSAKYWDETNAKAAVIAPTAKPLTVTIVTAIPAYGTASDANDGVDPTATYQPGDYYIYKTSDYTDVVNISTKANKPGGWVNLADNLKPEEPPVEPPAAEVKPYPVLVEVPSYGTALDAEKRTNPTGWKAVGDYYIYKTDPNGMKNISMAQTTPGAWINPEDNDIKNLLKVSDVVISSTAGVNLRVKPDNTSDIVTTVDEGATANVVIPAVKGWLKLEVTLENGDKVQGYSWSEYWDDAAVADMPNIFATPDYGNLSLTKVGELRTNKKVPLRIEPKKGSKSLVAEMPSGTILENLKADNDLWYQVQYNDLTGWILKTEADVIVLYNRTHNPENLIGGNKLVVYLDPGHRAVGTGAVANGLDEVTINWNISELAKDILESRGYTVYLSKLEMEDTFDLYPRITEANQLGADIYVSIHCNASASSASGTITFYSSEKLYPSTTNWLDSSILLSQYLAETIGPIMGTSKVIDDVPGTGGSYAINRLTDMPSSLLELGFLTSKTDSLILGNQENWDDLAEAIADGIDQYFGMVR